MKISFFLVFVSISCSLVQASQKWPQIDKYCVNAVQLPPKGGSLEKRRQYALCVAKECGFMDEKNEFNIELMEKVLSKGHSAEEVKAAIGKCAIRRENPGKTAAKFLLCLAFSHFDLGQIF